MRIIMLGPPGSGKGTVSERLERELKIAYFSTGSLFREEIAKRTKLGLEAKKYIDLGQLVPDEITIKLLKNNLGKNKNFILDGFPRTIEQAQAIDDLKMELVISLNVPPEVIVKRFVGRRICAKSGHSYHILFVPPKKEGICDLDGSPLIQRKDDNHLVIKKRFKEYTKKTKPLLEYYRKKKILKTVNGNQTPQKVYEEVLNIAKKFKHQHYLILY